MILSLAVRSLTSQVFPNFAPELFRRIRLRDPLKQKQLLKGLVQLSEEGAVQVFRPLDNNDLIVGAVGVLQFDVVVHGLKSRVQRRCDLRKCERDDCALGIQ